MTIQKRLATLRATSPPIRFVGREARRVSRRRLLGGVILLALVLSQYVPAQAWDTFSDTWVATDALGRALPTTAEVGAPKTNKFVGIFYFLWLEGKGPVYDISKILSANPTNPTWGPVHAFHFWGEPLFGYYRSDDEFVLRKHAQMLTDAGVDVVFLDVTNALTYDSTRDALCRVWTEWRRLGNPTPQIAFLANSQSDRVVNHLYDTFYAKGAFSNLWFHWQGKPLMLASTDGVRPEAQRFFTFRQSWAWTKGHKWFGDGKDKWPWLDFYPQTPGWHENPDKPEQISVCIAQHPVSNIGRSFHNGKQPPPAEQRPHHGLCFAEQWRRALEVNPPMVFVTGWNEWIAQRFVVSNTGPRPHAMLGKPLQLGDTFFVDQYNIEYSRDAEPMRGGYGDAYYMQLTAHIRRFKGARSLSPVRPRPIVIDGRFDDWREVLPEYRDTIGDPVRRNHPGWKGEPLFINNSGRNDIVAAKVSYDASNVYFYVRTKKTLTPSTDPDWMILLVDTDSNATTGWLGYDYVFRASVPGPAKFAAQGNEMEVSVPRSALRPDGHVTKLAFKWIDNIAVGCDVSEFTLNGDAAPNDRFNYSADLDEK